MLGDEQFRLFERKQAKLMSVPEFVPALHSKIGYKWSRSDALFNSRIACQRVHRRLIAHFLQTRSELHMKTISYMYRHHRGKNLSHREGLQS